MLALGKEEDLKSLALRGTGTVPILILAVVVLAGMAIWLFFTNRPPDDNSAEAGFARDMIVHHAQAVEMAEIVRDRTGSDEMRTLASDVALTQQGQIGQMQGWLAVWGLLPTRDEPAMSWMGEPTEGRMPGMAAPAEIQELRDASSEDADALFLELMVPHHQGALPMADAILERTDRPEVEQLARAISAAQTVEIQAMQEMLQNMGAALPEEPQHMHMEEG